MNCKKAHGTDTKTKAVDFETKVDMTTAIFGPETYPINR